jgi:hypothetical protein
LSIIRICKNKCGIQEVTIYVSETAQQAQALDYAINSLAVKDDDVE